MLAFVSSCLEQDEIPFEQDNSTYITNLALAAANSLERGNSRDQSDRTVSNPIDQTICITRLENNSQYGLYAVNYDNEQGYSIVTDIPGAEPILAIVENGRFNPNTDNPGLRYFLMITELYAQNISDKQVSTTNSFPPAEIKTQLFPTTPIVTTEWGQSGVYADFCEGEYTGCLTTALAQIMSCHNYPDTLHIKKTKIINNVEHEVDSILTLDWSKIKEHSRRRGDSSTGKQNGLCNFDICSFESHYQIAQLFRRICNETDAEFESNHTTNKITDAKKALDTFNYSYKYCEEWDQLSIKFDQIMILTQAGMPMAGLYHCNWGWDGQDDGYFNFDTSLSTQLTRPYPTSEYLFNIKYYIID